MSDQKMNVHIDLPKALAMVQQAINEASLYAGFTYNLKIDENFIKYDLTDDSALGLIPITDNLDEINLYKEHYYNWVIKHSFKYVIDRVSTFLDEIYFARYLFEQKSITADTLQVAQAKKIKFHKANFRDKLKQLDEDFQLRPMHLDCLLSMQSARTCLTHRDGVVRNADVKGSNLFKICWYSIRVYIKRASGDEEDFVNETKSTEGDVIMCSPNHYKEKILHVGDIIHFNAREFAGILLYILNEAKHIVRNVEEYALANGIKTTNSASS